MRVSAGTYFNRELQKIPGLKVPLPFPESDHYYQMYTITLENKEVRDGLQKYLEEKGIMSKVYFLPVHLKTLYQLKYGYKESDLPQTEQISQHILTLPIFPQITKAEQDYIIGAIKEYMVGR